MVSVKNSLNSPSGNLCGGDSNHGIAANSHISPISQDCPRLTEYPQFSGN